MSRSALRSGVLAALVGLLAACSSPAPESTVGPTATPTTTPAESPSTGPTPSPTPSIDTYAPPGWVDLSDVDPTILTDIRYHGDHNFLGRAVEGYLEPRCLLPRQTAEALRRVQTNARAEGYSLKVYDCYRPARAGEDFAGWARDLTDQKAKAEFYPRVDKSQLFNQGYVGGGATSHSSGSAIDLTLVALPPRAQRGYL